MDKCFWCGTEVGHQHAVMEVGGVPKKFHTNLFKDCANEYNRWQNRFHIVGGHSEKNRVRHYDRMYPYRPPKIH